MSRAHRRRQLRGQKKSMKKSEAARTSRVFDPIPNDVMPDKPLDPTLPVRTRDGRLAWFTEVDESKKLWPVKGYVHDPLGKQVAVASMWTVNGLFLNNKKFAACDQDLFNISVQEWAAGFEKLPENERTIHAK